MLLERLPLLLLLLLLLRRRLLRHYASMLKHNLPPSASLKNLGLCEEARGIRDRQSEETSHLLHSSGLFLFDFGGQGVGCRVQGLGFRVHQHLVIEALEPKPNCSAF